MDPVEKAARLLKIDKATFEKMARQVAKDHPDLGKIYRDNVRDKGLDQTIAEMQQELQEVLNHVKKSPNVR